MRQLLQAIFTEKENRREYLMLPTAYKLKPFEDVQSHLRAG